MTGSWEVVLKGKGCCTKLVLGLQSVTQGSPPYLHPNPAPTDTVEAGHIVLFGWKNMTPVADRPQFKSQLLHL